MSSLMGAKIRAAAAVVGVVKDSGIHLIGCVLDKFPMILLCTGEYAGGT